VEDKEMIERYVPKKMAKVWDLQHKYQGWLEVELAFLWAKAKLGMIEQKVYKYIGSHASFTVERIEEIDKKIEHDMNAFIATVHESLREHAGEFHKGITSYDIEDPALCLQLREAIEIIIDDLEILMTVVLERAKEHKWTLMMGRTHGVQGEPITLGWKLCVWHYALERAQNRLRQAKEIISYGKISGAMGVYGDLDPQIEALVCQRLGLTPAKASTQILQRDRHAEYMSALAITAGTLDQIATEIRLLAKTEVGEVEEPRKPKQKGSSAMPHKKNPIICERICGLARVVQSNAQIAFRNIATWAERDITQSSAERVIFPDSTQVLDYMIQKLTWVIDGLIVFPERMLANMEMGYGVTASQQVKVALLNEGLEPDTVYYFVQQCAFKAVEQKYPFRQVLLEEPINTTKSEGNLRIDMILTTEELDKCFDYKNQLRYLEEAMARFGL
jgi:adenylosuccinate lyase